MGSADLTPVDPPPGRPGDGSTGTRTRVGGVPGAPATLAALSLLALVVVGLVVTLVVRQSADDGPGAGSAAGGPSAVPDADVSPLAADPTTRQAVPARRAPSAPAPEAPRSALLPDGVRVPVRAVSTTSDGTLDVPDDIRTAGWWRGGARIGDPFGATLIAAHVDSTTQGLGPYAALLEVQRGERVQVRTAHLVQDFRIRSLRLLPQGSLTDEPWLFTPAGERVLHLVTCAPPYDRSRGGYQNLAVVTAVPVSSPARRPGS